jgi:acyl-CoA thioesterase YciA
MNEQAKRQPAGELVMRTIPMPADTNPNGDIFGGWVVSQMDLGGSVIARKTARCRVATVAVDAMSFIYPVNVGDLVSCYAELLSVGNTSMRIHIEVWVERLGQEALCATEGCFTYVAIDKNGRPVPVKS